MSTRKILAFTGIRSDYDLMSGLYMRINEDPGLDFGLIVSGAHLSQDFGYTAQYIENDGLPIIAKIDTQINSDKPSERLKSASILMLACIPTLEAYAPDVILFAGDREDAIAAALIGTYLKCPTIHFFGGDHATDGNVDNPVRHACSKLASLHFVAHETHIQRLIALGENRDRIHNIGSISLDRFRTEPSMSKQELLKKLNKEDWDDYALVIFHSILGDEENSGRYFTDVLEALKYKRQKAFVDYPNIDAGHSQIIKVIERYSKDENFVFFKNYERNLFVNLMRHASFMIGNSSSGLHEAPLIPLGVVNVGKRQTGRLTANNVIFVEQELFAIVRGIEQVLSMDFKEKLKKVKSIYGDGNSIDRTLSLLRTLDFKKFLYKTEDPLDRGGNNG